MATTTDRRLTNPLEANVGYLLRRASSALMGELAQRLEAIGLKISEASLLLLIDANPRVTQSELGRALGIQRANMVPLSAGLERRGLIAREQVDGRSYGLVLTTAGRRVTNEARTIIGAHESSIAERLGLPEGDAKVRALLASLWG